MSSYSSLQRLQYAVMKYDWGRLADQSSVAKFYKADGHEVDAKQTYAELWIGSHVNAPSLIAQTQIPLPSDLPYLFKILSIAKPLSIQSHPDKKLAEQLHLKFPLIYKDNNHKPEMMVAITPAEAFCGFITQSQYEELLQDYPILMNIFNSAKTVEEAFKFIMMLNKNEITQAIDNVQLHVPTTHIFRRIQDNFGSDVGVLCSFLLAYHQLKVGEAMYIGPNIPHSYISGELAEIMATSDNVIRAGCTTKLIDKQVLCQSLNYQAVGQYSIQPEKIGALTTYRPPVSEFKLQKIELVRGEHYNYYANPETVIFVSEGRGRANDYCLSLGHAFWTGMAMEIDFESDSQIFVIWISSQNNQIISKI